MDLLYDNLCNAWFAGKLEAEIEEMKKSYTEKQVESTLNKLIAQGIVKKINLDRENREKIEIRVNPKFRDISSTAIIQDIANQFGLLIYDKKFNDSVYGCFGEAQNIVVSARNKQIVLFFPECCREEISKRSDTFYRQSMTTKILNSINHLKSVNTVVNIMYE